MAQRRGRDQGRVLDLDAVMCLKLVADASQDRDGVFDARFVDDHWLKAALEGLSNRSWR